MQKERFPKPFLHLNTVDCCSFIRDISVVYPRGAAEIARKTTL